MGRGQRGRGKGAAGAVFCTRETPPKVCAKFAPANKKKNFSLGPGKCIPCETRLQDAFP